jgi:gliding motility-associated lipoprotein GldD
MRKLLPLIAIFSIALVFISCDNDFQPKPRGYFRIELPEREYQPTQLTDFPYSFEYSEWAELQKVDYHLNKYWLNIYYPRYKAKLHLSYIPIEDNLDTLLNDVHHMVNKHIAKASAINEQLYTNEDKRVFGMAFLIKGSDAASPYQFYVTDSIHHFLRGALYFKIVPNNDSLKPVIDYIEEDARHLIESLKWDNTQTTP